LIRLTGDRVASISRRQLEESVIDRVNQLAELIENRGALQKAVNYSEEQQKNISLKSKQRMNKKARISIRNKLKEANIQLSTVTKNLKDNKSAILSGFRLLSKELNKPAITDVLKICEIIGIMKPQLLEISEAIKQEQAKKEELRKLHAAARKTIRYSNMPSATNIMNRGYQEVTTEDLRRVSDSCVDGVYSLTSGANDY
jgi:hypothetical protein